MRKRMLRRWRKMRRIRRMMGKNIWE